MLTPKQARVTAIIILLASVGGMGYYFFNFGSIYAHQANMVQKAQVDLHIGLIHVTASDGTPIQGLLMASNENWSRMDHSLPFIILCHGMGSDFYNLLNVQYDLVKEGYVTLSLEFRGDPSNPAPMTLGSEEPWDILTALNWVEANVPCVN